jgi:hypothetical protein
VGFLLGVQVEDVVCEARGEGFGFHFGVVGCRRVD